MEINLHEKEQYVSIWLTKDEAVNDELRDQLKPLFSKYQKQKYRIVVFESGKSDLAFLTQSLLAHNLTISPKPKFACKGQSCHPVLG